MSVPDPRKKQKKVVICVKNLIDGMGDITHALNVGEFLKKKFSSEGYDFFYVVEWDKGLSEGSDLVRARQLVEMLDQRNIIEKSQSERLKIIPTAEDLIYEIQRLNNSSGKFKLYSGVPQGLDDHLELDIEDVIDINKFIKDKYVITISYPIMYDQYEQCGQSSAGAQGTIGKNLLLREHGVGIYKLDSLLQRESLWMGFYEFTGIKGPGILLQDNLRNQRHDLLKIKNKKFRKLAFMDTEEKEDEGNDKKFEEILNKTLIIPTYFIRGKDEGIKAILTAYEQILTNDPRDILIQGKFSIEEDLTIIKDTLYRLGFSRVEYLSEHGDVITELLGTTSEVSGTKKTFKILSGVYFSDEDYEILKKTPTDLFGCSGDNSFQDAISCGAIPIFIPHNLYKIRFLMTLKDLLKKEGKEKWPFSIQFLESYEKSELIMDDSDDITEIHLAEALKTNCFPELLAEWREVCQFLIREHNAYDYIEKQFVEMVNRTETEIKDLVKQDKKKRNVLREEHDTLKKEHAQRMTFEKTRAKPKN